MMALLEGKVQLLEVERGDMVVRHTGEREALERERGDAHEAHDAELEDTNRRIERLKAVCRAVQRRLMRCSTLPPLQQKGDQCTASLVNLAITP